MITSNFDFSDASFILFMDESITFNQVKNILDAPTIKDFFWSLIDGGEHRYGRIMWYLSALASYIPYKFFNDQGIIIAYRLLQSFLLLASYFLLTFTFIKKSFLRLLTLATLLSLPFTSYFSHLPKPEPTQLIFLTLFLIEHFKLKQSSNRKWIYLGIAFGSKISILPFCSFMLLSIATCYRLVFFYKAIILFLVGWIISVPIIILGGFSSYLSSTFQNTAHGADDRLVTPLSWINYILRDYFPTPSYITYIFFISILIAIIKVASDFPKDKKYLKSIISDPSYLLIICASSFILPIIIKVKRINGWGFYLHIGTVLLIIWLVVIVEKYTENRSFFKKTVLLLFSALLTIFSYYGTDYIRKSYKEISKRSKNDEHIRKMNEYRELTNFFSTESTERHKRILVAIDPHLYQPKSNSNYEISTFWGPFENWSKKFDYIVLYKKNFPSEVLKNISKSNSEYEANLRSLNGFNKNTNTCNSNNCLKLDKKILSNILILVLK